MAYYDALIAKWPTLAPGTTQQKLDALNAETVAGPATPMVIETYRIYNVIDASEFTALSAANQQLVRDILSMGTVDASVGTAVRTRMLALFGAGTATRTALAALAATFETKTISWAKANGYPDAQKGGGGITLTDLANAGGLT